MEAREWNAAEEENICIQSKSEDEKEKEKEKGRNGRWRREGLILWEGGGGVVLYSFYRHEVKFTRDASTPRAAASPSHGLMFHFSTRKGRQLRDATSAMNVTQFAPFSRRTRRKLHGSALIRLDCTSCGCCV